MSKPLGELPSFFRPEDLRRATAALSEYHKTKYSGWNGTYDGTGPGQRKSAEMSDRSLSEALDAQHNRELSYELESATNHNNNGHESLTEGVLFEVLAASEVVDIYITPTPAPQSA